MDARDGFLNNNNNKVKQKHEREIGRHTCIYVTKKEGAPSSADYCRCTRGE
jgi:hypothetical protein